MLYTHIYPKGKITEENRYPFSTIYKGKINLSVTSGGVLICHEALKLCSEKDRVIIILPFDAQEWTWKNEIKESEKLGLNINNIFYLCNYEKQLEQALSFGLNAELISETCFVDWDFWKPAKNTPKIFDALLSSRPTKQKRGNLANKVINLAIVRGCNVEHNDIAGTINMDEIPHSFISQYHFDPERMRLMHNLSYSCLCLSKEEAACRSSSQSLLCGVPVISTSDSTGGREVYYTEDNSIICEPTEDSVRDAVKIIVEKTKNGKINKTQIRKNYIEKALSYRKKLYKLIENILLKEGIKEDGEKLFLSAYNGDEGFSYYSKGVDQATHYKSLKDIKDNLK